jgi:hypothetical protein
MGMNGRIILKWIINTQCGSKHCIHLVFDWDYWWDVLNMEINLWVP